MDDLDLLIDLHAPAERLGPGGTTETLRAIELAGLAGRHGLRIADIGCGTGASALVLARELDAQVMAVDKLGAFLAALQARVAQAGLTGRVHTVQASMDALPFQPGSLDAIWSEGAIYRLGFEQGVQRWRPLLKDGGILAVSDLTWLTDRRPAELQAHWTSQYPQVDTASARLAVLERQGFSPLGYFVLPDRCWLEAYYRPMQQRFDAFLARHVGSRAAQELVAAEAAEIALYERFRAFFSYGFYVARKTGDSA